MTNNPLTVNSINSSESIYPNLKGLQKGVVRGAIALLTLSLLGAGGYVAYRQFILPQQQASQRVITLPVERRDLTMTVSANGTVKPEQSINVSPKSAGVLKTLLVKEGDTVQKGQIIAYMDDSNLRGQLTQAAANLAAAEATLQELVAGNRSQDVAQADARVKSAQVSLQQAEDDYRRYQSLASQGAISQQSLSQYKATRDTAEAKVLEVQQALVLQQKGTRPEKITQARAQVEASKGALQTIQAQISDTVLRSPFSGVVTRKYADPGAFVTPTTAGSSVSSATSSSVLALASTNQVVANIAENNISKIRLGQKVTFTADAYPGKSFQGKVTQIAAQATLEQNVTSFEVKMAIADPKNLLRSGMNVSLEFNVGQITNALVVPNAAVIRQQNVTGVLVAGTDNRPVFTSITTGATVGSRTEVKSGLQGTETVLLSLPADMPQQASSNRFPFPGLPGSGPSRSGSQPGNTQPASVPLGNPPTGGGSAPMMTSPLGGSP